MATFTICDATTKRILRTGECRDMDLSLQAKEGEVLLPGTKGDQTLQRLNAAGDGLEAMSFTLAEVRAKARELLDNSSSREAVAAVSVTLQGTSHKVPSRPELRLRLFRASLRAATKPDFILKLRLGGELLTLSSTDIAAAQDAVDAWENAVAAREEVLETEIQAASTKAAVNALLPTIRQFWP